MTLTRQPKYFVHYVATYTDSRGRRVSAHLCSAGSKARIKPKGSNLEVTCPACISKYQNQQLEDLLLGEHRD